MSIGQGRSTPTGGTPVLQRSLAVKEHPEWLITGLKGEIYRNRNLANSTARRHIVSIVEEALNCVLCSHLMPAAPASVSVVAPCRDHAV
jgi:hypothetical protein